MTIIVCIDDNFGMLFNHRRQSQDKTVREQILDEVHDCKLWMNTYSAKMFGNHPQIYIDEDFLANAAPNDYCFVENCPVTPYENKITEIILYKWNRNYPADWYFDIPVSSGEWHLVSSTDFAGNSHEKITKEVYKI